MAMWQMSPMEPPNFTVEPPSLIYFSNTTGTLINCQGQGTPQPNVTWLHFNDRVVTDIPGLRYSIPYLTQSDYIIYVVLLLIKRIKIVSMVVIQNDL